MDIYPAYLKEAFRIEFEWDEITRITKVDPVSSGVIEEIDSFVVYPAKHFVMPEDKLKDAITVIRKELEERYDELMAENKVLEAQRLKTKTEYDMEMMEEMGYCSE